MTGREILAAASSFVDEEIDEKDALFAINAAISEIGDMALMTDYVTLTSKKGDWETVSQDLLTITGIENSEGKEITDYRERNGEVRFKIPGKYTIWYRRMPKGITTLDDTPELHPAFHPCLTTYLSYWFKKKDDDENTDANFLYEKFMTDIRRVFAIINRKRTPMTVRVVR